ASRESVSAAGSVTAWTISRPARVGESEDGESESRKSEVGSRLVAGTYPRALAGPLGAPGVLASGPGLGTERPDGPDQTSQPATPSPGSGGIDRPPRPETTPRTRTERPDGPDQASQ